MKKIIIATTILLTAISSAVTASCDSSPAQTAEPPEIPAECVTYSFLGQQNGRIDESQLAWLSWEPAGFRLRPDAAEALERVNHAFAAEFGTNLTVTSTWRSYEGQHRARERHGHLAADPGTSNHGWGIAVDLGGGIQSFDTEQHAWMQANAPAYGWVLPAWADRDGGLPEPWHWEFHGPAAIYVASDGPVEITPQMWIDNCVEALDGGLAGSTTRNLGW